MNAEHLLDAVGLLDDNLLREAEEYRRPHQNHRPWVSLAACLAVVLVLGYGLTHLGMGGAAPNLSNGTAPSAGDPASSAQSGETSDYSGSNPDATAPQEPGANGGGSVTGDWLPSIRVDGVVYYWDTKEYIHLEPEEDDIRYTTSFIDSWEPEEDGQANFLPIGLPYVVLDDGTVAVLRNEETNTWEVYDSVPPWER